MASGTLWTKRRRKPLASTKCVQVTLAACPLVRTVLFGVSSKLQQFIQLMSRCIQACGSKRGGADRVCANHELPEVLLQEMESPSRDWEEIDCQGSRCR